FLSLCCGINHQSQKPKTTYKNSKSRAPVEETGSILFFFIKSCNAFIKKLVIELFFRVNLFPGSFDAIYFLFPVVSSCSFWWQGYVKSIVLFCFTGKSEGLDRRV